MTQSLNVAACAAVVLSEVLRRRTLPPVTDGARMGEAMDERVDANEVGALRLSAAEQAALEDELMPSTGGNRPPRLHNKAFRRRLVLRTKAAGRAVR